MIIKYIFLILFANVEAKLTIYITDAPVERIGARLYKKEVLTDQFESPKELAYDSSTRNLYFMYMENVLQNSGRAYVNVVTKQTMKIEGISRNKATAVDSETGEVYFGSDDGLYKYDPLSNQAHNIGLYNMNILKLVIRNNEMYLIDANNHMIYKVFNEGRSAIKIGSGKTVMEFDVDNNRNVYFVTMCGLYCAVEGKKIVKNSDLFNVYHFIVDESRTFGVTENGIYELNCSNGTANKVASLGFYPRSIIFGDYGDIYYSEDDNIYRLRPISSYLLYSLHKRT